MSYLLIILTIFTHENSLAQALELTSKVDASAVQMSALYNSEHARHEPVVRVALQHHYHKRHRDRYEGESAKRKLINYHKDQILMNDYLQLADHTKPRPIAAKKLKAKLKQKEVEKPLDTLPHIDMEDDSGGFEDRPSLPKNYHEQQDNQRAFRTQLLNNRDVSYLGPIFIGTPKSQGAMVVYDTGSDWLTVKACLTDQHCNKKPDKKKTLEKIARMGGDPGAAGLDEEAV